MKKNTVFTLLTLISLMFHSGMLHPRLINSGQNSSTALAAELAGYIVTNPSGELVPVYINKLIELAPFTGRAKIINLFKDAIVKLDGEDYKNGYISGILRLSIDELNGNSAESLKNFSIIKQWNVSGPWKKYGEADADFEFPPEKVFKLDAIERKKNISATEDGSVYISGAAHHDDETFYLTTSFAVPSDIVLWIVSDTRYKLLINGKETAVNRSSGKNVVKAFNLKGARGYTLQIKAESGSKKFNPYIRVLITDEKYNPADVSSSRNFFSYSFTSGKIFSSDETAESIPAESKALTEKMKEMIRLGDYSGAYKTGVFILEKFPSYCAAYDEFIPLLDIMNRDNEFNSNIGKYLKLFPDSDIHYKWIAAFYMSRDMDRFKEIMKTIPVRYISKRSSEAYIYLLCGEKRYSDAVSFCSALADRDPFFRDIIPEMLRAAGNSNLWRSKFLEETASRDEADLYYALGLAEMQSGLDPVMYWEKGYSADDDSSLLRDLSDIYENSILGSNDYYTGIYTDLHPEFLWNGKKRRVSIHLFENGRVILEGEDIIPSGRKIGEGKNSAADPRFSSGKINTSLPYLKGLKVLYLLKAKDGLPTPVDFKSEVTAKGRMTLNYKSSGDEEFSVIKYTGEYVRENNDIISILNNLVLKTDDEKISEINYEIICHGNFVPLVLYNGESLSPGKYADGTVKFIKNDKLSKGGGENIVSSISRFSSDSIFAGWYRGVITYAGESPDTGDNDIFKNQSTERAVKDLHFYIMSSVSKRGELNFNPRKIDTLLLKGEGSVEERTLLARGILEKRGIKSYISFRKNKGGLINKILLYVPESRDRGYWLDFYGDGISDKMESGYTALVITGEGFETFPVNPETYIR